MKHSKLLLLPLLFMVTSCVSISNSQEGPLFDPDNGHLGEDPNVTYYEDDKLGDPIQAIPEGAKKLVFTNGKEKAEVSYDIPENSIADDFPENNVIIKGYESKHVFQGVYGLILSYDPHDRNNFLKINLADGISAQYLSINCSPTFYNTPKNNASGYDFVSSESAIQVARTDETLKDKYVKLKGEPVIKEGEDPNIKHVAKTFDVTFDLGKAETSFTLRSYLHSVVINSITFF